MFTQLGNRNNSPVAIVARDGFAQQLEDGTVENMYIEYYRKHYMQPDDNPPIGMLPCTAYGKEMVEYLKPFTDPQLFIATYELQLPSKEKIQEFLIKENHKS